MNLQREGIYLIVFRWAIFLIGMIIFSLGITMTIKVQYLGIHPWDVLNVVLYEKIGLSIGSWAIIIGALLIVITWIMDKNHIKIGTFLNAFMVGLFVDFFLWLDFLPSAIHSWIDILFIITGIVVMGIGGGIYNAAGVGSGPRDGFMLSISERLNISIRKIRIITESLILLIGLLLGGPVFIFTVIFTFIQSPIFQYTFLKSSAYIQKVGEKKNVSQASAVK